MRQGRRAFVVVVVTLLLVLSSISLASASPNTSTTVEVTPNDVQTGTPTSLANAGTYWWTNDTKNGGTVGFVNGPGTPPLGAGSLQLTTNSSSAKAQLYYYGFAGTSLSDISDITYSTYRDSASTNSAVQYPSLNLEVDYKGDGTSYTTLVWEPDYAYGQSDLKTDTWQTWDAMAASQTADQGGWWSTHAIPGVCAFNCYVSWQTIVSNNPNAKVVGGFGINIGSGWAGTFQGNADALAIDVGGSTTTFNFEPLIGPPTSVQQCVRGGWQSFNNPQFRNMPECVLYVVLQPVRQMLCYRDSSLPFCSAVLPTSR